MLAKLVKYFANRHYLYTKKPDFSGFFVYNLIFFDLCQPYWFNSLLNQPPTEAHQAASDQ